MSGRALLILGCGFTGMHAARVALEGGTYERVVGVTRSAPAGGLALGASPGLDLRVWPEGISERGLEALAREAVIQGPGERGALGGVDVLVSLPPSPEDPSLDERIARWIALRSPDAAAYLSTTGVYGDARGDVDEGTPVRGDSERARVRIASEETYRSIAGAVALRAAGIYGPGRGLHRRVALGEFRLPGDGSNVVSRVHARDLARVALASLEARRAGDLAPGSVFAVADDAPVPQREAVAWLCAHLGKPLPPSVPVSEAPATLRHDRRVRNARVKEALRFAFEYPSYREGFAACLADERERGPAA